MSNRESRPAKPYPTFPLFARGNGSWTKKIGGKNKAFGSWRNATSYEAGWRAALAAYNAHLEAVALGEQRASDPFAVDLSTLVDGFLSFKHRQFETGEIAARTFSEIRSTMRQFRDGVGGHLAIRDLEADPTPLKTFIAVVDEQYGWCAYNRAVQHVRSLWRWARHPAHGILSREFKWSDLFKKKPVKLYRRQRRLERAAGQSSIYTPEELRALVSLAPQPLRAMLLLGYFAGYGNTDIAELPRTALKVFDRPEVLLVRGQRDEIPAGWGVLTFPRPKTEIDRVAVVPPLVVQAIREVEALKIPAGTPHVRSLVFRNGSGMPMLQLRNHNDEAGLLDRVVPIDYVRQTFDRFIARIGKCEQHGYQFRVPFRRDKKKLCPTCRTVMKDFPDRTFYDLRHTATTYATVAASSDARCLFEGHASSGQDRVRQTFYLDPTQLHELLNIARELVARMEFEVVSESDGSSRPTAPKPSEAA